MKMQKSKGFTLIELMIALGIIGVLVGIAIPQYRIYSIKTEGSTDAASAMRPVQIAVELYAATRNSLPADENDLNEITAFDEATTCSGIVQTVEFAGDAAGDDGRRTTGTMTVTFYTDGDNVVADCQINGAETANVPEELSGETIQYLATLAGNGHVEWRVTGGSLQTEYRPTL